MTDPDAVLQRMRAAWSRIEDWLAQHSPETHEDLRPPATDERLDAIEAEIGYALDPGVRALYRVHDGESWCTIPFEYYRWFHLDDAIAAWRGLDGDAGELEASFAKHVMSKPPGAVSLAFRERGWFPIGSDGCGNTLVVDHAPGPAGRRGQVTRIGTADWSESRGIEFPSVLAAVERLADALVLGAYAVDEDGDIYRDESYTVARFENAMDSRGVPPDAPERSGLHTLLENLDATGDEIVAFAITAALEVYSDHPTDERYEEIVALLRDLAPSG